MRGGQPRNVIRDKDGTIPKISKRAAGGAFFQDADKTRKKGQWFENLSNSV
jgi:hypothetical protein